MGAAGKELLKLLSGALVAGGEEGVRRGQEYSSAFQESPSSVSPVPDILQSLVAFLLCISSPVPSNLYLTTPHQSTFFSWTEPYPKIQIWTTGSRSGIPYGVRK